MTKIHELCTNNWTLGQDARPSRPRRPSLKRQIAQAEKATGKPVTSITLPDGTKLVFAQSEPMPASSNDEWDERLNRGKH